MIVHIQHVMLYEIKFSCDKNDISNDIDRVQCLGNLIKVSQYELF